MLFFFFKQKTAYEMRISDWSSDVCSSDLALLLATRKTDIDRAFEHLLIHPEHVRLRPRELEEFAPRKRRLAPRLALAVQGFAQKLDVGDAGNLDRILEAEEQPGGSAFVGFEGEQIFAHERDRPCGRSEEHTSELQSLMRISYAVFCLTKQ